MARGTLFHRGAGVIGEERQDDPHSHSKGGTSGRYQPHGGWMEEEHVGRGKMMFGFGPAQLY